MKKFLIMVTLIVTVPQIAHSGEWVLWRGEFKSNSNVNPPVPLSEHKSLKACHDASAQSAVSLRSSVKKDDEVDTESVMRFVTPDGVLYNYKNGGSARTEYRCYPYGVVPTQGHFQPKATQ